MTSVAAILNNKAKKIADYLYPLRDTILKKSFNSLKLTSEELNELKILRIQGEAVLRYRVIISLQMKSALFLQAPDLLEKTCNIVCDYPNLVRVFDKLDKHIRMPNYKYQLSKGEREGMYKSCALKTILGDLDKHRYTEKQPSDDIISELVVLIVDIADTQEDETKISSKSSRNNKSRKEYYRTNSRDKYDDKASPSSSSSSNRRRSRSSSPQRKSTPLQDNYVQQPQMQSANTGTQMLSQQPNFNPYNYLQNIGMTNNSNMQPVTAPIPITHPPQYNITYNTQVRPPGIPSVMHQQLPLHSLNPSQQQTIPSSNISMHENILDSTVKKEFSNLLTHLHNKRKENEKHRHSISQQRLEQIGEQEPGLTFGKNRTNITPYR